MLDASQISSVHLDNWNYDLELLSFYVENIWQE